MSAKSASGRSIVPAAPVALAWAVPFLLGGCFIGLDRAVLSDPGDGTGNGDEGVGPEGRDDHVPDDDDGDPGADGTEGTDVPGETESPPPVPPEPDWIVTCGTAINEKVSEIAALDDGTFVAVGYRYETVEDDFQMVVVKIAPRGEILWTKSYGGDYPDRAYDIEPTRDGGVIVAASSGSYGNNDDGWLILKLDAAGDIEWQKDLDRSDEDMPLAVVETPGGSFAAAGYTSGLLMNESRGVVAALGPDGSIDWKKAFDFGDGSELRDIVAVPGGGFVSIGSVVVNDGSARDALILELNAAGAIVTPRVFGSEADDEAVSVVAAGGGGYVAAGTTSAPGPGTADVWAARLSASLEVLWQKFYTGPGDDVSPCVRPHPGGGFVLTAGSDSAEAANGRDLVILKLDDEGSVQWGKTFGGDGTDANASCPVFAPDGGIVFAGETGSFGAGGVDILVVKLGGPQGLEQPCSIAADAALSGGEVSFEFITPTAVVFDAALEELIPIASPDPITLQSVVQCD